MNEAELLSKGNRVIFEIKDSEATVNTKTINIIESAEL